jgi:predicted RND superfamily exporter protein
MGSFYRRFGPWITLALIAAAPWFAWASMRTMQSANNDVAKWLPPDTRETTEYATFRSQFVNDEFAIVSWDGLKLGDQRIEEFGRLLVEPPESGEPLFASVQTGNQMLAEVMASPLNFSRETAIERLRGFAVGLDGEATLALVRLTEAGRAQREQVVQEMKHVLVDQLRIPEEKVRMAGSPVVSAAVDSESRNALATWVGLAMLVAFVMAFWALRSTMLVGMIFLLSTLAALIGLAQVWITGGSMNLVLVVMPILLGLLSLSAAVHLVNYYREESAHGDPDAALKGSIRKAFLPSFLSAATTAIGLGSLATSEIGPVRDFGIYAASGTMISFVLLFLWLPFGLDWWSRRQRTKAVPTTHAEPPRWLASMADFVIARYRLVLALCAVLFIGCGLGTLYIDTTVKPTRFFQTSSDTYQDIHWVDTVIGPHVSLEVVLDFDQNTNSLSALERLDVVRRVEAAVAELPDVGNTMSAATFVPPDRIFEHEPGQRMSFRQIAAVNKLMSSLDNLDYFHEDQVERGAKDRGHQRYRVTARLEALNRVSYEQFTDQLRGKVEPVLAALADENSAGIRATYTGMDPVFFRAQRKLLEGLQSSFLTAFVLIGLVMCVLLRGPGAGLVSMLPNVFPAVFIFGTMGWLNLITGDMPVDVGSMMTASVAMGIAVDGTLHFLSWFRRGVTDGLSRVEAVRGAYLNCGNAMLQTALIAGLGQLVLGMSGFLPVSRFGIMMCLLLFAGVLADLLLTPALLVSPLGKLYVTAEEEAKAPSPANPRQGPHSGAKRESVGVAGSGREG